MLLYNYHAAMLACIGRWRKQEKKPGLLLSGCSLSGWILLGKKNHTLKLQVVAVRFMNN